LTERGKRLLITRRTRRPRSGLLGPPQPCWCNQGPGGSTSDQEACSSRPSTARSFADSNGGVGCRRVAPVAPGRPGKKQCPGGWAGPTDGSVKEALRQWPRRMPRRSRP
jgi:hypothetical protein